MGTGLNMISEERWRRAQEVEAENWRGSGRDVVRFLYELVEHSEVAVPLDSILRGKQSLRAIEVGIGPLGIGFLAAYTNRYLSAIMGVEPLPIQELALPDRSLDTYAKGLRSNVTIMNGRGESLPFRDGSFDIACCINVLDHSKDSETVISEISRVLKKGGIYVCGVNTLSHLGRFKWKIVRTMRPNDPNFIAHPFTYYWSRVNKKLTSAPWARTLWDNKPSFLKRVAGHGRMAFWIVTKG